MVIGHAGIGVGLLIEAAVPSFAGVLVGQAVWGLAYTFTSGATVAWLAGELGDPDRNVLRRLFLRASRLGSLGALVAVPLSFVLGINVALRTPLIVGGCLSIVLALWLEPGDGRGALHAGAARRAARGGGRWGPRPPPGSR